MCAVCTQQGLPCCLALSPVASHNLKCFFAPYANNLESGNKSVPAKVLAGTPKLWHNQLQSESVAISAAMGAMLSRTASAECRQRQSHVASSSIAQAFVFG